MEHDPILVINCAADTERRAKFTASAQGANITFIDGVDARLGAHVFKPYLHLLGNRFWLDDDIKPGAFACFISHRLAWQYMIDHNIKRALIAEDDSILLGTPFDNVGDVDLIMVNDRAAKWVPTGDIQDVLNPPQGTPRAIGGDGYVLSQKGAAALLAQSTKDGVVCGVDWYLIYAAFNSLGVRHKDVKAVPEMKRMLKIMEQRAPILHGRVAQEPWVKNNAAFQSSIVHGHRININIFRQDIENA